MWNRKFHLQLRHKSEVKQSSRGPLKRNKKLHRTYSLYICCRFDVFRFPSGEKGKGNALSFLPLKSILCHLTCKVFTFSFSLLAHSLDVCSIAIAKVKEKYISPIDACQQWNTLFRLLFRPRSIKSKATFVDENASF